MCSNSDDDEVKHSTKYNSLFENAMNAGNSNKINNNISHYFREGSEISNNSGSLLILPAKRKKLQYI